MNILQLILNFQYFIKMASDPNFLRKINKLRTCNEQKLKLLPFCTAFSVVCWDIWYTPNSPCQKGCTKIDFLKYCQHCELPRN